MRGLLKHLKGRCEGSHRPQAPAELAQDVQGRHGCRPSGGGQLEQWAAFSACSGAGPVPPELHSPSGTQCHTVLPGRMSEAHSRSITEDSLPPHHINFPEIPRR